jgi:hypothetical protein
LLCVSAVSWDEVDEVDDNYGMAAHFDGSHGREC